MAKTFSRDVDPIQATRSDVVLVGGRFGISNATGTLLDGTDMTWVISGSSALGRYTVQMADQATPRKLLSLVGQPVVYSPNAGQAGVYSMYLVGHNTQSGSFTFELRSGSLPAAGNASPGVLVTGQSAAQVATAGLTGSVTFMLATSDLRA